MSEIPPAFAHHPELFGKIADPMTSFFRTLRVENLIAERPEMAAFAEVVFSDEVREKMRAEALADHREADLWVFGYGSLMWDPAFRFAEVRRAVLPGFSRQFVLKDIHGGRGTQEAPGLMAALDRGGRCEGLLFRIVVDDIDMETEILWRREVIAPGYDPIMATAQVDGRDVRALTFVADHGAASICPDLTPEEQVQFIATGTGFLGSSREYLENVVSQLAALGIHDQDCRDLLREVENYQPPAG